MSINVAIIGSGIFAAEEHIPAILASPILTLRAIYSRSLSSAQSLYGALPQATLDNAKPELYSDDAGSGKLYSDLLLRQDIHAVILALPILSQPKYIVEALAAGKHVLSEKPIAGDLQKAQQLIDIYRAGRGGDSKTATWSVAENFRFLESFDFAQQECRRLGRILGFRIKMFANVKAGSKYFETAWRKKPEYQGGFLLDGGVHFVAATRLLLGEDCKPSSVSAFTAQLQEHLPPVDTVNSIWQTRSGVSGTFSASFGITLSGSEYMIACEHGSVAVRGSTVTVIEGEEKDGKVSVHEFNEEGSGVKQEVKAWAEAIVKGEANEKQSPEQALADLEILEQMLKSGEAGGQVVNLKLQT